MHALHHKRVLRLAQLAKEGGTFLMEITCLNKARLCLPVSNHKSKRLKVPILFHLFHVRSRYRGYVRCLVRGSDRH